MISSWMRSTLKNFPPSSRTNLKESSQSLSCGMYRVVLFLLFHFYTNSIQKYLFTVFSYFYTYLVPLHEGESTSCTYWYTKVISAILFTGRKSSHCGHSILRRMWERKTQEKRAKLGTQSKAGQPHL